MTSVKEISNSENSAVEQLRARFADELSPKLYDNTLMFYRFLKARDFNLNNAEHMLRKHIEWRKEQGIDNILSYEAPEVLEKYIAHSRFGFDKDGCPARYVPLGRMDARGYYWSARPSDVNKVVIRELERDLLILEDYCNRFGKVIGGCVYIYDMEGLSFSKATDRTLIANFMQLSKIYQDNYPEMLKTLFVLNPPMFITIPFAIIKTCLTGTLVSKINFTTKRDWKEELLKQFDADQLPAFLGGNMTDPDGNPMCYTIVRHAAVIPESYYIHKSKRSIAQDEGVKQIMLLPSSRLEVPFEVKESGSQVEWEFETDSKDISFGLFLQEIDENGKKLKELVPVKKTDMSDYSETGMYKYAKKGIYVILFDNSYSWIHSKQIYYKLNVVPPQSQEMY
ncbi:SEC14-like protein 2 [Stegodyphus dumicola]|uniref:SEC14-like protein 2 n=1 Tax=Stegodyphus dumicola TaxID=202533 RepID=UPI0015A9A23C|nr:SEC14-like protein 2 [Stegodyphus dumicola]